MTFQKRFKKSTFFNMLPQNDYKIVMIFKSAPTIITEFVLVSAMKNEQSIATSSVQRFLTFVCCASYLVPLPL